MSLLGAIIPIRLPTDRIPWLGRAAQAWFLAQVRRADPSLAETLHAGQSRRPYTLGIVRVEDQNFIRITSLSAPLTSILLDKVLNTLDTNATLAGLDVQIGAVETATHPWSGRSDFDLLAQAAFANTAELPTSPGFEFATPTTFHSGGLSVPLPLPTLVYGSLIQSWNTFSPVALPVALQPFLEQSVGVARHRISTRLVRSGDQQHVGFTGMVRFALMRREKTDLSPQVYALRVQTIDLLTRFAFYAGIGAGTSAGMGQVRPLDPL